MCAGCLSGGQIENKTNKSDLPCWLTGASLSPAGSKSSSSWWEVSFPNPLAIKSLNNSLSETENLSSWRAGEELSRKPHAWEKGWASHQASQHDRRLNRKFFISPDFCRQKYCQEPFSYQYKVLKIIGIK